MERGTITAVEPQARRKERVSIYLDGKWALGTHAEVAVRAGLHVGQQISAEELLELACREETRKAREDALSLLGYRARSRQELRLRLARKGYSEEVTEAALSSLEKAGLVDDEEFSRAWVRARTGRRPMGAARLSNELRARGVDSETVRDALAHLDEEKELELALQVLRSRGLEPGDAETPEARRRLFGALRRRGFSYAVCARALETLGSPGE